MYSLWVYVYVEMWRKLNGLYLYVDQLRVVVRKLVGGACNMIINLLLGILILFLCVCIIF